MDLKKIIKYPLVFFVTTAAMLASFSNLIMKFIGASIAEEEYIYLIPTALTIIFTATRTLFYVNKAQRFYNQMEVMPIYQTMIMVLGIVSGMLCLGESKLYKKDALGKIGLAILVCMIGIWRLLQK